MSITDTVRDGIIEAVNSDGSIGQEFKSIPGHEHMLDLIESDDEVIDAIVAGSPGWFPSEEGITEYLTEIMEAAQENPHGFMGFLQEYGDNQHAALAKVHDGDLSIMTGATPEMVAQANEPKPQHMEVASVYSAPDPFN